VKLSELLGRIQEKPRVMDVSLIEEHPPYKFYRLRIRESEDVVRETAICIYVENEGTDQEAAYFKDMRPVSDVPDNPAEAKFRAAARAIFLVVENINVMGNWAVARGFVENGDYTVSRKSYLLTLDEDGNPYPREIV